MYDISLTQDTAYARQLAIKFHEAMAIDGQDMTEEAFDCFNWFVLEVSEHGRKLGCFLLRRLLPGVVEWHTLLDEDCRGKRAIIAAKEAVRFWFDTDASMIVSYCFEDMPHVLWAAKRSGFKVVGRSRKTLIRHGQRVGLSLLAINHPQLLESATSCH